MLNWNELVFLRSTKFNDPHKLIVALKKYVCDASISYVLHLEGEKVLSSTKGKPSLSPMLDWDSHNHDCINFSYSQVDTTSMKHNLGLDIMGP
jgi:hypothetical protein